MAITRTQIARQLLQFGGGADLGAGASGMGSGRDFSPSRDNRDQGRERSMRDAQRRADLGRLANMAADEKIQERLEPFRDLGNRNTFASKAVKFIPGVGLIDRFFGPFNSRDYMLDRMTDEERKDFSNLPSDDQEEQFQTFVNRFTPDRDDNNQIVLPQTMFAQAPSITKQEPEEVEEPFQLSRRFRAEGGMMNTDVVGGEMDFESARQMYGLGKLVKKVTRSVKKIAKSPIGKAALIGATAFGIPGTSIGGLFGRASFGGPALGAFGKFGIGPTLFANPTIAQMKTKGLEKGFFPSLLDKIPGGGVTAAITGASALAGALTPEEENEAQQLVDNTGIDIEAARNSILAARREQYAMDSRARRFRAEGGSMKEPVAKKTMPLLDLDGKEMDLRAEGGFVPIGRMEKADDVPARLSKNEFVFTADAVRNAGEGDVDKGAEVMYNMMKNLEAGGEVSEESQGLQGARKMFQTSQRLEEVL